MVHEGSGGVIIQEQMQIFGCTQLRQGSTHRFISNNNCSSDLFMKRSCISYFCDIRFLLMLSFHSQSSDSVQKKVQMIQSWHVWLTNALRIPLRRKSEFEMFCFKPYRQHCFFLLF